MNLTNVFATSVWQLLCDKQDPTTPDPACPTSIGLTVYSGLCVPFQVLFLDVCCRRTSRSVRELVTFPTKKW